MASTDWMQHGAKAKVTMAFGIYSKGDIVYIDESPVDGVVTVNPAPGDSDWQFMPVNSLEPATD